MSDLIIVEKINRVATMTLNRPNNGNAIHLALAKELFATALKVSHDPEVRAVLLTGNGKHFSFGGDLKSFANQGEQIDIHLKEVTTYLHHAVSLFMRMNKLVIAAVNGTAAGAGLSLLCACDIVLASDKAMFTSAYTKVGLTPDGSCTYFLPRLIGLRKTQELVYLNRVLSAEEAVEWGIITKVFKADELEGKAFKVAEEVANGPVGTFGSTKQLLNSSFLEKLDSHLAMESDYISKAAVSSDGKEGIAAFLEKRAPMFN